jgi:hypothetical protein
LSPQQAAAVLWGQSVKVDDLAAKVDELFQSTIRQAENPEAPDFNAGDVFYGFTGTSPAAKLIVRWNASYINFFQGHLLPEKEILAAFGQTSRK